LKGTGGMFITIYEATLSDQSLVYNVAIGDEPNLEIVMPCVTYADADKFAYGLRDLISAHTNKTAVLRYL
jgi:hypothetical protein